MRKLYHIISILFLFYCIPLSAAGISDPVKYPDGTVICSTHQLFFWQIEPGAEASENMQGRLLISTEQKELISRDVIFTSYKNCLYFTSDISLAPGRYTYEYAPLYNNKFSNTRYFGYRKYPVQGSFSAADVPAAAEKPELIIDYINASQLNHDENRGNALFFSTSACVSGVAAALFFSVLRYNIWTDIAGSLCAASSAAGIGASGYYTWQYYSVKKTLDQNRPAQIVQRDKPFTLFYTAKF